MADTARDEQDLGATFPEVSRLFADVTKMLADPSGRVDPAKAVALAGEAMPHSDHCAITLIRGNRRPRTIASTDPLPEAVDALQYRVDQGPCLDAADSAAVVEARDLNVDERWPEFAPACVRDTGVQSMLSFRLAVRGSDHAGMNFYARHPRAFDEVDVRVGSILAAFAALAVEQELRERDTTNYETALRTSRQIGAAIGIVMATEKVTEEEAFRLLRRTSNELNRKLADIADHVGLTGSLPRPSSPRSAQPG
jgi:GAF domain-containing protein